MFFTEKFLCCARRFPAAFFPGWKGKNPFQDDKRFPRFPLLLFYPRDRSEFMWERRRGKENPRPLPSLPPLPLKETTPRERKEEEENFKSRICNHALWLCVGKKILFRVYFRFFFFKFVCGNTRCYAHGENGGAISIKLELGRRALVQDLHLSYLSRHHKNTIASRFEETYHHHNEAKRAHFAAFNGIVKASRGLGAKEEEETERGKGKKQCLDSGVGGKVPHHKRGENFQLILTPPSVGGRRRKKHQGSSFPTSGKFAGERERAKTRILEERLGKYEG